ncbi:MAG: type III pantothenate kinase [Gemmatimonadales bacterium]
MLFALDIGNTEITAGVFREDVLVRQWRMTTLPGRTPDEWAALINTLLTTAVLSPTDIKAACLVSVAPGVTRSLITGLSQLSGRSVAVLDTDSKVPLILDVDEPLAVGPDRIANALAALELLGGDAVVIDFGTATTFDCVTGDGRFIGGPIMPGLKTSADELTQKAARLPATELTAPSRVIGRRTDDCIKAGVLYGAADAVDGMIRRIREEWPGDLQHVVATGGLAEVVVPFTSSVDRVIPGLTLEGVRVAAKHLGLDW